MKLIKSIPLIILLFFMTAIVSQAQQRGLKISIKNPHGESIAMYDNSFALLIGASNYQHWPQLPGVKKDITAIRKSLKKSGFTIEQVIDPDAAELKNSINRFISQHGHKKNARLLFYFAGHGHTLKLSYGEDMGYIIPIDAPNPQLDKIEFINKSLDMQLIEVYAKRIQAKHALFVFDSCFSGSIFALSRAAPSLINYKTNHPVRQFITSGSANETVPDDSLFRKMFVSGIQGEADLDQDGYVTGSELGGFLQSRVINYSKNSQHPQYGKIRNPLLDKGDFVFVTPNINTQNNPRVQNNTSQNSAASEMWSLIKNTSNITDIDDFLSAFPKSAYTPAATLKRKQLVRQHPNQTPIKITLISNQDDSLLTIDQQKHQGIRFSQKLLPGHHTLSVTKPGFESYQWQGKITQTKTFSAILKASSNASSISHKAISSNKNREITLTVYVHHDDSYITIDKTSSDEALHQGENIVAYIKPGKHKVLIESPNAPTFSWEGMIDQNTELNKFLNKVPISIPKPFTLNILSNQNNSNISIDEQLFIGNKIKLDVSKGIHHILVKKVGYKPFTWSGQVTKNKTIRVNLIALNQHLFSLPELVKLPQGCFQMGSKRSLFGFGDDPDAKKDETQHEVCLEQFKMTKYEITEKNFHDFISETGYRTHHQIKPSQKPITHVNILDIQAYSRWLSKKSKQYFRLPTEAEWEYAARAKSNNIRHWGDDFPVNQANCLQCNQTKSNQTQPVGQYKANDFGLHDMLGNVAEWTCSLYQKKYQGSETRCSSNQQLARAIRGGSWQDSKKQLRAANREQINATQYNQSVGFRLVSGSPLAGLKFINIKGGCYDIGAISDDSNQNNNEKTHKVCLKDFAMSQVEISQSNWLSVFEQNPSFNAKQTFELEYYPVENISLQKINQFINQLNQYQPHQYRLPTEAEWEYAAKEKGQQQIFPGNENIDDIAWYSENSQKHSHPIASKQANSLEIFDLSGNVREWTCSKYSPSYNGEESRCSSIKFKHDYVQRGGDWNSKEKQLRTSNRRVNSANYKHKTLGFRLVKIK
ncbi:MAG: SUMF1/EgtB/PvdO family nonheme iron enzyme [Methylococcales bacterium]|jgi:formylglycine-generating enzyme required for sulfatase activity|nr:SUMF1/EgtB/PvdO family nonheme iron enzyme [Methylococcales bacterium]